MEIEYSLEEADLIALANYQVENSTVLRKRSNTRRLAYLIGFSLLATGFFITLRSVIIPISFASLGVLLFIFYPLYSKWSIHRNIPRVVRDQIRPSSVGNRKLKVSTEGLEQIFEGGESKVRWNKVDNIIEGPEHTFISIEESLAIIVPRFKIEKSSYEEFMSIIRLNQSNSHK